jgi:5-methylcytosine-specific restriction endonuclease McrA
MGDRPPQACRTSACPGMAVDRGYCSQCVKTNPQAQVDRPFSNYRGTRCPLYDLQRWRKPVTGLRDCTLRRDPICKLCNRNPSSHADHIRDHHGNPVLFFDFNNLRGLCADCHNARTLAEHGKGNRGGSAPPALVNGRIANQS